MVQMESAKMQIVVGWEVMTKEAVKKEAVRAAMD